MRLDSIKLVLAVALGVSVAVIGGLYFFGTPEGGRGADTLDVDDSDSSNAGRMLAIPDLETEEGGTKGRVELNRTRNENFDHYLPAKSSVVGDVLSNGGLRVSGDTTIEESRTDEEVTQILAEEWSGYTGLTFTEADKRAIFLADTEWRSLINQFDGTETPWEERVPFHYDLAVINAIGVDRIVFEIADHTMLFTTLGEDVIRLALQPSYPDEYRVLYEKYGHL